MFAAASRLIGLLEVDKDEEPPAHLLDCLDFEESSSEDEDDLSEYVEEIALNACEAQIQHQDGVNEKSEQCPVSTDFFSKSPSISSTESSATQKLFHRYVRMYLKLIFQSSTSESQNVHVMFLTLEFR